MSIFSNTENADGSRSTNNGFIPGIKQKKYNQWNEEWTQNYAPQWEKYGAGMQRELQTAYDRSLAEARSNLGYSLSATGSGEGGLANASRLALETEAQNKRMDIATKRDQVLQQAYLQFMQTKDAQSFEMAKMKAGYEYNKQIAEMNQPSWWESLGGIVGSGFGIVGGLGWQPFASEEKAAGK
jgi:hypothetical protein